jgi:DNA-binding MarR family transcriptional regulator/ribosomal protein S14
MSITHDDELAYRYELKINQYELEMIWLNELLENTTLSGEEKNVLWVIRQIIRKVRYDLSVPVHIWMAEIARRSGLGESTVRKVINRLHNLGLIIKETRGTGKNKRTWFSIPSEIDQSSKGVVKDRKRNRGGARQRCEECGSENVDVYTLYACRDCGHIHREDTISLIGHEGTIQQP